jgi:hypothetical protein
MILRMPETTRGNVRTAQSEERFSLFADNHNAMLKYCSQIADLDIPSVLGTLEGTLATTGDGPLNSEGEQARQKLKENITIARLALEIHREVKRQIRSRYNVAWQ